MRVFDALLAELEARKNEQNQTINSLEACVKEVKKHLLDDSFKPSKALENLLDKYLRRIKYPMEIAIAGQFSSGKSTFLNALLSKDILPTGITPVTSKVNFLNYADEYRLKVTYKDGATQLHNIEHLSHFSDQRASLEDVKYLSIYAPVELLKQISFVDTPGLNSQSHFDTNTTQKVLRDVDGIIWLGLIDAVAKKSELDILERYLPHYAHKSICLLNQKDKFDEEQIQKALAYAYENYGNYFSKIIPISAKEALDSRLHQAQNLIKSSKKEALETLKIHFDSPHEPLDSPKNIQLLQIYQKRVESIELQDFSNHLKQLEASNILEVLEYIQKVIAPKAKEAKVFSIKKDLDALCNILLKEYDTIAHAYTKLYTFLQEFQAHISHIPQTIHPSLSEKTTAFKDAIEYGITTHTQMLQNAIEPVKMERLAEVKQLLSTKVQHIEYTSYVFNTKKLHVDTHEIQQSIQGLKNGITTSLYAELKGLKKELYLWQLQTQKLHKSREVASDEEFNVLHHFSASAYENILNDIVLHVKEFEDTIDTKLSVFAPDIQFEQSIYTLALEISEHLERMHLHYLKEPQKSVINSLDSSDIKEMIKESLDMTRLKREFSANSSLFMALLHTECESLSQVVESKIAYTHTYIDDIKMKKETITTLQKRIEEMI